MVSVLKYSATTFNSSYFFRHCIGTGSLLNRVDISLQFNTNKLRAASISMTTTPNSSSLTQKQIKCNSNDNIPSKTVYTSKRHIRIYTRSGDKGQSSLFNGERRPKHDPIFEALGDCDELNASIGVAKEYLNDSTSAELKELNDRLIHIQSRLIDVGSAIAMPLSNNISDSSRIQKKLELTAFDDEQHSYTLMLEQWIDGMEECLPPLTNFILPGGGLASAHLHVSRAVCRRCERRLTVLLNLDQNVVIFINRLSDFLFVAARFTAMNNNQTEHIYQKEKK